jgi:hypothetical protein
MEGERFYGFKSSATICRLPPMLPDKRVQLLGPKPLLQGAGQPHRRSALGQERRATAEA